MSCAIGLDSIHLSDEINNTPIEKSLYEAGCPEKANSKAMGEIAI
jgi:hypothetical protein